MLAAPGALLDQGYDYMFWAQADGNGRFTIPAVRPGSYAVHVYATKGDIVDDPDHGEVVKTIDCRRRRERRRGAGLVAAVSRELRVHDSARRTGAPASFASIPARRQESTTPLVAPGACTARTPLTASGRCLRRA